jgi:hypothetical protein
VRVGNVKAHCIASCQPLLARPKSNTTLTSFDTPGLAAASVSHHPFDLDDLDLEKGENDVDVPMGFEGSNVLNCDALHCSAASEEPVLSNRRRVLRCFYDVGPCSGEDLNDDVSSLPAPSRIWRVLLLLKYTLQTAFDLFGFCQLYPHRPSFELNKFVSSSLLARSSLTIIPGLEPTAMLLPLPYLYANTTIPG